MATKESPLRERKKERTRLALVEAAIDLFERKGFESTTIAEIAAAAEVAPRTFFAYFPAKEDVLFADTADRLALGVAVFGERGPADRPADLLMRLTERIVSTSAPESALFRRLAPLRLRLAATSPSVQGHALRQMYQAQRMLAEHLHRAYADELDEVTAAAMVGSFIGALIGAGTVILRDLDSAAGAMRQAPAAVFDQMSRAAEVALRGIIAVDQRGEGR